MHLDKIHCQKKEFPDSGSSLINPETFEKDKYKGALQLSQVARNNDIKALISQIDDGITNVNTPAKNAKGWTPLHFACKTGHFECAKILIENGANIDLKTDKNNTPLQLIKGHPEEVEKLTLLSKIVKAQASRASGSIANYSIFSRHPERLKPEYRKNVETIETMLEQQDGRKALKDMLNQL